MIKPIRYNHKTKLKRLTLFFFLLISGALFSQDAEINEQVPPPPCDANGNNGFGGAVGEGQFLASDPNSVVQFNMSTSGNEMNDILVVYIDTFTSGRNSIDSNVDDSADAHRIAISNSNAFGFGSYIQFPEGFNATYAVAINTDFAGLWEIPASGPVGNNGLNFISAVDNNLTSNTQISYQFNFEWADIGLTENDTFNFVATYVSATGYSSDEGYGSGIVSGTEGADDIIFNGYLSFPECNEVLNIPDTPSIQIEAKYFNNQLYLSGFNAVARVRVYDILGQEVYSEYHKVKDAETIPLRLSRKQLYFIVIQSEGAKEVIKVMPTG